MVIPVVHEIPSGTTSREPDLSHHPLEALQVMAQQLRRVPACTPGASRSLLFVERELHGRALGRFA